MISRHIGKAIAGVLLAGGAALFGLKSPPGETRKEQKARQQVEAAQSTIVAGDENEAVLRLIAQKKESPFIEIKNAKVVKLLRADNRGARHQRWLAQVSGGPTVMVVHNIDLAEKVPLEVGQTIDAGGELVFHERTHEPILHWTHADPRKKRLDGYVLYMNKRYGSLTTDGRPHGPE